MIGKEQKILEQSEWGGARRVGSAEVEMVPFFRIPGPLVHPPLRILGCTSTKIVQSSSPITRLWGPKGNVK